jgi:hypothetical protein
VSQYKLIQDIEAEDKILGPLTLRQFIFALVAVFLFYICFILITKHIAFMLVVFLPPALFCLFFAVPFGRDQPTEVWALAKVRFYFKPRKRIWNQSGVKELVTITVPKKVERVLTNGLSQTEVKSRLRALADTIDTRGWATKNVNTNLYNQPMAITDSDRLIDIGSLPQEVPAEEMPAVNDIMDEANNPIAQQFETMIDQSSRDHRQQLIDQLNSVPQPAAPQPSGAAAASSSWFVNPGQAATVSAMPMQAATSTGGPSSIDPAPIVINSPAAPEPPEPTADEKADEAAISAQLSANASSQQVPFGHLRTLQPLGSKPVPAPIPASEPTAAGTGSPTDVQAPAAAQNDAVTATGDPDILSLAKNDDLNVATLAREAHKKKSGKRHPRDEVTISLH